MKKVYFMIYDMGGGHRSTASALQAVIKKQNLPWKVHVVEVFKEIFQQTSNHYIYNELILKKKWAKVINEPLLTPSFRLQIRFHTQAWRNLLRKFWREHQPNLVVSILPLVNQVLCESLQAECPGVPFFTLPIDLADSPPHFWIEPQKQLLFCPSEKMVEEAQEVGYQQEQIFRTSGVVINPRFYEPVQVNRLEERKRLGLKPDLPTALMMFGGHSSNSMVNIVGRLEQSSLNLQLICICGHNQELVKTLSSTRSRLPIVVEGFTHEIPYYMHLSDLFIGKPGPGSINEALTMKLPVIVECNGLTLFTEKYNAEWIVNQGVGIVINNFQDINRAVREMLQPENFARYQTKAATINNQAVFEVVDILAKTLDSSILPQAVTVQ